MVQVKFSDIGEGMNEGEIIHYFVQVGDEVEADQPLVEMQTDKMVAEIPAPSAGTIKAIHFNTGEVVTVGTVLIEIETGQENHASVETNLQTQTHENSEVMFQTPKQFSRILAAPYTRKIARELNIDIEQLTGTGPAGRVTDEDVRRYAEGPAVAANDEVSPQMDIRGNKLPRDETIPFKGIRKQIAVKMSHSLSTIPHVTHFDQADLTNVLEFRSELKESGENISVAAFFVKAIVITLKEHKIFNAQLDEKNEVIRLLKSYNIGIATNTNDGLMVPVLHNADRKSLRTINAEMITLTQKAQKGQLSPENIKNGTFTVNNVGPLGGIAATPIINHPETGIITFHKTKKMPVVMANDEIAVRSIMTISFSFDHRVADGAQSIAFINRFVDLIENPKKLLLELV
ncbi:dihydrolipoamide acetyltransferase family protein [Virgibacillus oceani]|uniref:Dihydrolipoamide acetyltransferase component of pyruvate dehydrogenase complex n=1 Tax=Virgibacillus oceani TaxID=1479511 RepID=A0A917HSU8_9BACI|nr:dihydrolipoamide acetyltransferase family protein [Virgibacillus oceani]GGG88210.1 dihydrolipoamide acetyltransferase component of pyruvate dehydrogenase complex [Virgibacillus oceani]